MKKVLLIFILILIGLSIYSIKIKFYPDYLMKKAVEYAEKGDFVNADKYYRKAGNNGKPYAKCNFYHIVYNNIKDEKKLEKYKKEYKDEKLECKFFSMEGIWTD